MSAGDRVRLVKGVAYRRTYYPRGSVGTVISNVAHDYAVIAFRVLLDESHASIVAYDSELELAECPLCCQTMPYHYADCYYQIED